MRRPLPVAQMWIEGPQAYRYSSSPKQACDGDVLINLGPVNAVSAPDEPPFPTLLGDSVRQTRKPGKRRGQLAPVRQSDDDPIVGPVTSMAVASSTTLVFIQPGLRRGDACVARLPIA